MALPEVFPSDYPKSDSPVAPKPPKGFESLSDRAELATKINLMVTGYQSSMSARLDQWQFCQDVYDDVFPLSSLNYVKNAEPYNLSLMSPRADGLAGSIVDPIVMAKPHFVFEHASMPEEEKDAAQATLQYALSRALFERKLRDTTLMAILRGRGVMRLRYQTMKAENLWDRSDVASVSGENADDFGEEVKPEDKVIYSGLVIDTMPPERSIFYPTYEEQVSKLTCIGHWIPTRYEDLIEKQAQGLYFSDVSIGTNSDTMPQVPQPTESRVEDFPTKLFDLIVKIVPPGEKREKQYRVTYIYTSNQILAMEEYTLPTPYYFAPCPRYEIGQFWPRRSVAERALEAQTVYNDAVSGIIFAAAAGTVGQAIISGYTGDSSDIQGGIGTIITLKNPVHSVTALPINTNVSMCARLLEEAKEAVDGIMHYSPAALGQNFSGDNKTATAANLVAQGQAAGITDYIGATSIELERMADLARYLIADNWVEFKAFHGDAVPLADPAHLEARYVVELAGKAPSRTPDAIRNNLQMFIESMVQLGIQPDVNGLSLNLREVISVANELMGFPTGMLERIITDATTNAASPQGIEPGADPAQPQGLNGLLALLSGTGGRQAGIPPQNPGEVPTGGQGPMLPPELQNGMGTPGPAAGPSGGL